MNDLEAMSLLAKKGNMKLKLFPEIVSAKAVKNGGHITFGIYLIDRLTFFSNYYSMGYVEVVTKVEFDKKFKAVVDMLS